MTQPFLERASDALLERKLYWRVMPALVLLYTLAYLDRTVVGFVKDELQSDLVMSATAYGLGAGIFFIGYALFEVPSNILLAKVGARVWLTRIAISWSVITLAIAFSPNATVFNILRFLLGVAEAGLFPGAIYYMAIWFPRRSRARAVGYFTWSGSIAAIIGGPIAGAILSLGHIGPFRPWQTLFMILGVASLIVGVVVFWMLRDSPDKVSWLSDAERDRLREVRVLEESTSEVLPSQSMWRTLGNPTVLVFVLIYFAMQLSIYGVTFWLPTIIGKIPDISELGIGFASAVPWIVAAIGIYFVTRYSDASGKRRILIFGSILTGAVFEALSVVFGNPVLGIAALSISLAGFLSASPVFWTLPSSLLQGTSAAAAIALIGGLGNVGGFVGPYIMGAVEDATGSVTAGLPLLAITGAVGACLVWFTRHRTTIGRSEAELAIHRGEDHVRT